MTHKKFAALLFLMLVLVFILIAELESIEESSELVDTPLAIDIKFDDSGLKYFDLNLFCEFRGDCKPDINQSSEK